MSRGIAERLEASREQFDRAAQKGLDERKQQTTRQRADALALQVVGGLKERCGPVEWPAVRRALLTVLNEKPAPLRGLAPRPSPKAAAHALFNLPQRSEASR
jgi:hypothetical protein